MTGAEAPNSICFTVSELLSRKITCKIMPNFNEVFMKPVSFCRIGVPVVLCMVFCLALLSSNQAHGQQATAKIVGTITDSKVRWCRASKSPSRTRRRTLPPERPATRVALPGLNLPIGTYKIVARHEGFRPLEVITAPLEINQSFRADLKLEVGAANEQVLVESQAAGWRRSIRRWVSP